MYYRDIYSRIIFFRLPEIGTKLYRMLFEKGFLKMSAVLLIIE